MDKYNILDEKKIKNKKIYKVEDKIYRKKFYILEYESIDYSDYKKDKQILLILSKLKEKGVIYDFIEKVSFDNNKKKFFKVFKSKNFKHKGIFNSIDNVSLIDVENMDFSEDNVKTTIYSPLMIRDLNYIKTLEIDIKLKAQKELTKVFSINDFLKLKTSLDIKLFSDSNYQLNINFFNQSIILTQDKIIVNNKEIFIFHIKELLVKNYNYSYQLYSLEEDGAKILIADNPFLEDIQFLEKIIDRWAKLLPKEKLDITKAKDFSIFGAGNNIYRVENGIEIDIEKLPSNATLLDRVIKYGYLTSLPLYIILLSIGLMSITLSSIIVFIAIFYMIYKRATIKLVLTDKELKYYKVFAFYFKILKYEIDHIDIESFSVRKQKEDNEIYYKLYLLYDDIEMELIKTKDKELINNIKRITVAWNKRIKRDF